MRFRALTLSALAVIACSEDKTTAPVPTPNPPLVTQTVDTAGGTVDVPGRNVSLTFPPGALGAAADIEVRVATSAPAGVIGDALEFGPDGETFATSVLAVFRIPRSELGAAALDDDLVVRTNEAGSWVDVPTRITPGDTFVDVTAYLAHFSTYAVVTVAETNTLYGTFGFADDDVYAYGASGIYTHFDGTSVTALDSGLGSSVRLFDGWGPDASTHYCAGWDGDGRVWREQGGVWIAEPIPVGTGPTANQPLVSICGDGGAVVAVGHGGRIVADTGSGWQDVSYTVTGGPSGDVRDLRAVTALFDGEFLIGGDDIVLRGTPGSWVEADIGALFGGDPYTVQGAWARGAGDAYLVGSTLDVAAAQNVGFALSSLGTTWSIGSLPVGTTDLRGVWGDNDDVYAVGANGLLLRHIAGTWAGESFCESTNRTLFDVWAADAEFAAASGGGGTFVHAAADCDTTGGGTGSGNPDITVDTGLAELDACTDPSGEWVSWESSGITFDVVSDVIDCGACSASADGSVLAVTGGRFRGIGNFFSRVEVDVRNNGPGGLTLEAYAGGATLDLDVYSGTGSTTMAVEVATSSFYLFSLEGCDYEIGEVRVWQVPF